MILCCTIKSLTRQGFFFNSFWFVYKKNISSSAFCVKFFLNNRSHHNTQSINSSLTLRVTTEPTCHFSWSRIHKFNTKVSSDLFKTIGKIRAILWTIAAVVSSTANGKFVLSQNDPYFPYRIKTLLSRSK